MSTNAHIVVKIRKEDLGTKKRFSSKITPTLEWNATNGYDNTQGGREKAKEVELTHEYVGVYEHWDGDEIGKDLLEHHNTYEKALNLVLGGHISYIKDDKILHYANRKGEKWCDVSPRKSNHITAFTHAIVYLFDYDHWEVKGLRAPYDKFYPVS